MLEWQQERTSHKTSASPVETILKRKQTNKTQDVVFGNPTEHRPLTEGKPHCKQDALGILSSPLPPITVRRTPRGATPGRAGPASGEVPSPSPPSGTGPVAVAAPACPPATSGAAAGPLAAANRSAGPGRPSGGSAPAGKILPRVLGAANLSLSVSVSASPPLPLFPFPRRYRSELKSGGATLEPGRAARAAAEDQLLRGAGRSQRDQEAAECLTPLCHGWLKKNHHNHNKGGSGGGEAAAAGEGAAGEGAAGSGAGGSMKRRGGRGGSMRSVVGFLSQRGLEGDPLLTQDFQRRRLRGCRNLYKKDLLGHFGCVNAIEFSNNGGQWLVSGKANAPPPSPPPQKASSSSSSSSLPSPPPRPPPPRPGGRGTAAPLRVISQTHRCPGIMFPK